MDKGLMTYSIPVFDGTVTAQLVIPRSLTRKDAERLKRMIDAVRLPDEPHRSSDPIQKLPSPVHEQED